MQTKAVVIVASQEVIVASQEVIVASQEVVLVFYIVWLGRRCASTLTIHVPQKISSFQLQKQQQVYPSMSFVRT